MSRTTIYFERTISASHVIPNHPGKCARLHGHTYRFEVWLVGEPANDGMLIDFHVIKREIDAWDHRHLNDIVDFIPTAELLAADAHQRIAALLAARTAGEGLCRVRLWETPTSYAEVGPAW